MDNGCEDLGNGKSECYSFGETNQTYCLKSKKKCKHHCNHSWTHDFCCWCNKEFSCED